MCIRDSMKVTNAYQLLCKKGNYEYYFRDDRDIILVRNTKTKYVWKTGVDAVSYTHLFLLSRKNSL